MTFSSLKSALRLSAMAVFCALPAAAQTTAQPAATTLPQAEVPTVTNLKPVEPHWVFVNRGSGLDGMRIFDGDTGKMQGLVNLYGSDNFQFDPTGKRFFVSQTIWTKVDRGQRQDLLAVYDSTTLKLLAEVNIPGRMLIGNRTNNLVISSDAKRAFVYNMQPSSSVNVVNLDTNTFEQKIELPGCATMFPNTIGGFSALCSNGSMATIALDAAGKPSITHTQPFFQASADSIFDTSVVDRKTGKVTLLSYSGLIYSGVLGATPKIEKPWSIQEAAGVRKGVYTPMDINWYPGGRMPLAVHFATNRAFVMMHMGEYWGMKLGGDEIWVLDLATHKLIMRQSLPEALRGKIANIAISQDAEPVLFGSGNGGFTYTFDPKTLEKKRDISSSGGGTLYVNYQ